MSDLAPVDPTLDQLQTFLEEAEQKIPTLNKEINVLEQRLRYKRNALNIWKQRKEDMKKRIKSKKVASAKQKWEERRIEMQKRL